MYGVVLIAAMTGVGPSYHCNSGPVLCCPVSHGCCGVIQYFMPAPYSGTLTAQDAKDWGAYVDALRDSERADAVELWKKLDDAGRKKLLIQVRAMKSPDREKEKEPDKEVRGSIRPGHRLASNRR